MRPIGLIEDLQGTEIRVAAWLQTELIVFMQHSSVPWVGIARSVLTRQFEVVPSVARLADRTPTRSAEGDMVSWY